MADISPALKPNRLSLEPSPSSTANMRTPSTKMNNTKYRGIVARPMQSSASRAQEEYKLFVSNPDDIDHNLYGKFLGVLKDAGIPWKARKLPDAKEDAMHTMNALVLAINAYQHYQNDVVSAYAEIESSVSQTRSHSQAQASDVSKLQNDLTVLRKEFSAQTRTLAKEQATSKETITNLRSKLLQTERDLSDASIQIRKLKNDLEEEKKLSKALTIQALPEKPQYGRQAARARKEEVTGSPVAARQRSTSPSPFPWVKSPASPTEECLEHVSSEYTSSNTAGALQSMDGPPLEAAPARKPTFQSSPPDVLHNSPPAPQPPQPPLPTMALAHKETPESRPVYKLSDEGRGRSRTDEAATRRGDISKQGSVQQVTVAPVDLEMDEEAEEEDSAASMPDYASGEKVKKEKSAMKKIWSKLKMNGGKPKNVVPHPQEHAEQPMR